MAKYYVEYSLDGVKSRLEEEILTITGKSKELVFFASIKAAWLGLFGSLYTADKSLDDVEAVEIKREPHE